MNVFIAVTYEWNGLKSINEWKSNKKFASATVYADDHAVNCLFDSNQACVRKGYVLDKNCFYRVDAVPMQAFVKLDDHPELFQFDTLEEVLPEQFRLDEERLLFQIKIVKFHISDYANNA